MTTRFAILGLLLTLVASVAPAQEFPALEMKLQNQLRAAAYDSDTHPVMVPRPPAYFAIDGGTPRANGLLTAYPARFYGLERYELTRLDMALEGAGRGMTLGLFAGAIGTTAGLFGEETAWYVAGGMAALGALLGGAQDDPALRIRYRWIPPPELEGEDTLHRRGD